VTPSPRARRAERIYRLLLRAYPKAYRSWMGDEMAETFLRDHAGRLGASGRSRLWFWLVTIAQAFWFGVGERIRPSVPVPAQSAGAPPRLRFPWTDGADLRFALRLLGRSPLFAVPAVCSLAIGIAASAAIFGLADALLLQTPGVRDAARVVELARVTPDTTFGTLSYPVFRHLRDHAKSLDKLAAVAGKAVSVALRGDRGAERAFASLVSASYFEVVGARPARGRFFLPAEDAAPEASPVAVLGHRLWRERFQADPRVVGRTLRINHTDYTVVGVAEAAFDDVTVVGTDLWVPIAMAGSIEAQDGRDRQEDAGFNWHRAVGRLRPGVSRDEARAELNTLLAGFRADHPEVPATDGVGVFATGRLPPPARLATATFVGVLLLLAAGLSAIACSNVAGLMLARATARRREMAMRVALGAGRARLIRQMLVETLVLFVAAALLAVPLTLWLTTGLEGLLPPVLPVPIRLGLGVTVRMLALVAAGALLAGLVFGLAPAQHALRTDLAQVLHGGAATAGRDRLRLRRGLVAAQVALSLAMVATAGLFVRTLHAAASVRTGFATAGVEIVSLDAGLVEARGPATVALLDRIVERFRAVGGVEAVGIGRRIPMQSGGFAIGSVTLPGGDEAADARVAYSHWDVVSPGFFEAVGLPLLEGRAFTAQDSAGRPDVAIVNETFARAAWPGRSAIGQRFTQHVAGREGGRSIEVVGVSRDARYASLAETPGSLVYVPFAQHPQTQAEVFVKHEPGRRIAADLRAAVRAVDPNLPILTVQSFDYAMGLGVFPQLVGARVAGLLGGVGMFLAALGLYGLCAFVVAQRTREFGVRMALGASAAAVRALVLRQSGRLAAVGAFAGVGLAWALGRVLQSLGLLIGVAALDPLTLGAAAGLLAAVLFVASDRPARRAAATDPAVALRVE
jgi:predicted permease